MDALGYEDLSFREVLEFSIHNVNPSFIKEMRESGLDLNKNEIVDAAIHGVNPSYIKEVRSLGFGNLDFRDILEFKIHGVNARLLDGFIKKGKVWKGKIIYDEKGGSVNGALKVLKQKRIGSIL